MHEEGSFAAAIICRSAKSLAAGVVERQLSRDADAVRNYGAGILDLAMDTEVRLGYLAEALATDRLALLNEQLSWVKVLCAARGVPATTIRMNLECMIEELEERLPERVVGRVAGMLQDAMDHVDCAPNEVASFLADELPYVDVARQFLLAVLEAREQDAVQLVMHAFDAGATVAELHEHVLHRVQNEVGRMWQMAEVTVAEEHYCTGIVTTVLTLMRSRAERPSPNGRRVITATVSSETHALGILLVTQAFESEGWSAISLGANTPASAIAEGVRDFGCDVIALSVNMVLYIRQTAELIASLRSHAITAKIPIMVGGQPFNLVPDLWQVVGADGYAPSAMSSPAVAMRLCAEGR